MIVLRRPGLMEISEADAYIFRVVRQACAGQKTAPWAFHVVGLGGMREVTGHPAPQDPLAESRSWSRDSRASGPPEPSGPV